MRNAKWLTLPSSKSWTEDAMSILCQWQWANSDSIPKHQSAHCKALNPTFKNKYKWKRTLVSKSEHLARLHCAFTSSQLRLGKRPIGRSLSTWLTIQPLLKAMFGQMNSGLVILKNIKRVQFSSSNVKTIMRVRNSDFSDYHHNYIKHPILYQYKIWDL